MSIDQSEFDIKCEWGLEGVKTLAPISDTVIIVDVMSFSTAVSVAVSKGADVFPYRWKDDSAIEFAKSKNAILAGPRSSSSKYSLSPLSLMALQKNERIVLPSPNGSTLSLATGDKPTFAGCLRNAEAVAQAAMTYGPQISVIPCGERWKDNNSLRPAFEDLVGAGAIISYLKGTHSPEAKAAVAVFENCKSELSTRLEECSSGKELIEMGFRDDIQLIADLNCDHIAPILLDGAYVAFE